MLLAGSALTAPAILTRPAEAAEFTYKLATTIPPEHPINDNARNAAKAIAEKSGGRVQVEVFPGYILGSSTSALSQLRQGSLELLTISGAVLSTLVPVTTIYNTAFVFPGYDQVWKALDGPLGDHIRGKIAGVGLHVLDKHWDLGFRNITTGTKPIRSTGDLRELKIRVPVAPLFVAAFKALQAAPAAINFDELYTALQTRVVDAQENDLIVTQTGRLYEVQKFCAMTGHIWDGYFTLMSRQARRTLPDDLRSILETELNAAAVAERNDVVSRTTAARQALEKAGMTFTEPDRGEFRAVLKKAGFYTETRAKFGDEAWGILESIVGPLT
jgi:tripartite ATP-independent transporter DctP family solute receptor